MAKNYASQFMNIELECGTVRNTHFAVLRIEANLDTVLLKLVYT